MGWIMARLGQKAQFLLSSKNEAHGQDTIGWADSWTFAYSFINLKHSHCNVINLFNKTENNNHLEKKIV